MLYVCMFVFEGDCAHRDLHGLTHAFPTRRSSDLIAVASRDVEIRKAGFERFVALAAERHGFLYGLTAVLLSSMPPSPSNAAMPPPLSRSEEHTSELQSLMRISYAVFCFKKQNYNSLCTYPDNYTPTTHTLT